MNLQDILFWYFELEESESLRCERFGMWWELIHPCFRESIIRRGDRGGWLLCSNWRAVFWRRFGLERVAGKLRGDRRWASHLSAN